MALSAPSSGFVVEGNTSFLVEGKASDETGLGNVTAIISDLVTGQIIASKSVSAEGLSDNFSIEIDAGDRYTPTKEYMLRVTAQDLAGNNGSGFANIEIIEFPLAFRGLMYASNAQQDIWNIAAWMKTSDTTTATLAGPTGLNAVSGILSDDRNEFFVLVQSESGTLRSYDQTLFDVAYVNELNEGGAFPVLTDIGMNATSYFAPSQVPPYLRVFRDDGSSKGDFEDMLYPGTAVCVTDSRVYAGAKGVLGSPLKLDAYNLQTEALAASINVDWEVLKILEINEDQIAAFGNKNGLGYVDVIDKTTFTKDWELSLDADFVDAAAANGQCWVLTSAGLKALIVGSGTFSNALATGTYHALAVDKKSNRLYLGTSNGIEERATTGVLLRQIPTSGGPVKMIAPVYNK